MAQICTIQFQVFTYSKFINFILEYLPESHIRCAALFANIEIHPVRRTVAEDKLPDSADVVQDAHLVDKT